MPKRRVVLELFRSPNLACCVTWMPKLSLVLQCGMMIKIVKHMSLFGRISYTKICGHKYWFIIVDDFSRFTWVFYLNARVKSSTSSNHLLRKWKWVWVEKQGNEKWQCKWVRNSKIYVLCDDIEICMSRPSTLYN